MLYLGEISEDTGLVNFRPRFRHEKVQQQLMMPMYKYHVLILHDHHMIFDE